MQARFIARRLIHHRKNPMRTAALPVLLAVLFAACAGGEPDPGAASEIPTTEALALSWPADTPGLLGLWYDDGFFQEVLGLRIDENGLPIMRGGSHESEMEPWPCDHCVGDAYSLTDRIGDPDMLYVIRPDDDLDLHVNCEFGPCSKKRTMRALTAAERKRAGR